MEACEPDGPEGSASDDAIFAELYLSLRRFASVVRPAEVDADDLVQEALARMLTVRSLAECDDPGAYLRTAIVRLASNHRRSFGRRGRAMAQVARAAHADVQPVAYPSDLDDLLRIAPRDRAALFLLVVEGRSFGEVAEILGCGEQAARMRVSRALKRLRVELESERQEIGDA